MGLWRLGRAETSGSGAEHLLSMHKALASICGTTKQEVQVNRGLTSPREERVIVSGNLGRDKLL